MSGTTTGCRTIMVVEDDEPILFTIQELLESEGYTVVTAKNGKEAIERMEQIKHPCLILLDMFMPVMDGWQFIEQLKLNQDDKVTQIPIVVTSAAGERARQAGQAVSGYIKKPIDLDQLLSTVEKFCGIPAR
jgi:CheY-like chemotaxis protein